MKHRMHKQRGLTAVELMIVLAIAAILVAMAVPNFSDFLQRYRATTAANEILRTLTMARSRALTTGQRVAIAPLTAGNWPGGWRVFIDADNDGTFSAGDTDIEQFAALASDFSLGGTDFGDVISFNQFGYARTPANVLVSGNIIVTLGSQTRTVTLDTTGRAQVSSY